MKKRRKIKEKALKEEKFPQSTRNFLVCIIAAVVLVIGLYGLSFYTPKEDTLKIRPAPPLEIVPEYNNRVLEFGETCGKDYGNCNTCLECIDNLGNKLAIKDFKDSEKKGSCRYIAAEKGDSMECPLPMRRCDGNGNCIKCFKDEHCGDCSRCVLSFFKLPGEIDEGKCIAIETKNNEKCTPDLYRDGFERPGICYHGNCIECLDDMQCPGKLRCSSEHLCTA